MEHQHYLLYYSSLYLLAYWISY